VKYCLELFNYLNTKMSYGHLITSNHNWQHWSLFTNKDFTLAWPWTRSNKFTVTAIWHKDNLRNIAFINQMNEQSCIHSAGVNEQQHWIEWAESPTVRIKLLTFTVITSQWNIKSLKQYFLYFSQDKIYGQRCN